MAQKRISVGIIQENPIVGDIEGNLNLAISAIEDLSSNGSPDIFLFSEMFITGYPPEDLILRDDLLKYAYDAVKKLSEVKPESFIVIGYPKKEGDLIYNCAGVLRNHSIITEYKKQELPNYEVFDEKRYFEPGSSPGIFEVSGFRVALSVCEDIWHEKVIKQAYDNKADLILNINASPYHLKKIENRKELLINHSSKYSLPIVYANQIGGQDELVFDGTSMAIDGRGKQVIQLAKFKKDLKTIIFEDKEGCLEAHSEMIIPDDNELEEVYQALVVGARDYIEKNKFHGAIIGSSGGIDSALTAAIAADAIGADKVRTFMMPFEYTSDMSIEDAAELANNLGINIKFSYVVVAAQGYKKVKSADIAKISDDKEQLGSVENIKCDCICVSGFWTPTIHLASQSGNKTKFNEEIDAFVPGKSKQNETTVGSANGIFSLEKTITTAFEKGHEISKKITNKNNKISVPQVSEKKFLQVFVSL